MVGMGEKESATFTAEEYRQRDQRTLQMARTESVMKGSTPSDGSISAC